MIADAFTQEQLTRARRDYLARDKPVALIAAELDIHDRRFHSLRKELGWPLRQPRIAEARARYAIRTRQIAQDAEGAAEAAADDPETARPADAPTAGDGAEASGVLHPVPPPEPDPPLDPNLPPAELLQAAAGRLLARIGQRGGLQPAAARDLAALTRALKDIQALKHTQSLKEAPDAETDGRGIDALRDELLHRLVAAGRDRRRAAKLRRGAERA